MALWLFTDAILNGRPIDLFNGGNMKRDFTYVDDVVAGVLSTLDAPPADDGEPKPGGSLGPHSIYNVGNNRSELLARLIEVLEDACGREAIRIMRPLQPGDVRDTYADISAISRDHGFAPSTTIEMGVPRFVRWFRDYHRV